MEFVLVQRGAERSTELEQLTLFALGDEQWVGGGWRMKQIGIYEVIVVSSLSSFRNVQLGMKYGK